MNLAQLIDPEFVQQGFPQACPAKPAPCPPMGTVTHVCADPADVAHMPANPHRAADVIPAVRRALATEGGPFTTKQVFAMVAGHPRLRTPEKVNSALGYLERRGDVEKGGTRRTRVYSLTEQGKARL